MQNQDKSFIYTFIDDYRKYPTAASPYLVITLFDELKFSKGVILIRGDVMGDLTVDESHRLLQMTKDFFGQEHLYKKVIEFNKNSRSFDFNQHTNNCLNTYFSSDNQNYSDNKFKPRVDDTYEDPVISQKRSDYLKKKSLEEIDKHGSKPVLNQLNLDKKK